MCRAGRFLFPNLFLYILSYPFTSMAQSQKRVLLLSHFDEGPGYWVHIFYGYSNLDSNSKIHRNWISFELQCCRSFAASDSTCIILFPFILPTGELEHVNRVPRGEISIGQQYFDGNARAEMDTEPSWMMHDVSSSKKIKTKYSTKSLKEYSKHNVSFD